MSNHAYIYGKLPSVDVIDADIREIISRQFPEFVVEKYGPGENGWNEKGTLWMIKMTPERSQFIWTDKFKRKPCLEFRHGHGADFFWWVEYEVREQLAVKYGLKANDDGIGDYKPEYKPYKTLIEYLNGTRASYLKELASWHYEVLPKSLWKYLDGIPNDVKMEIIIFND